MSPTTTPPATYTTDDGYTLHRTPEGWWTDGDLTFTACPACGRPWKPRLTAPRVPLTVRCACCQQP